MSISLRTVAPLIVIGLFATPSLHAALMTWVVDDNGVVGVQAPNDGLVDFNTIEGAVNSGLVTNQDIIEVRAGTYTPSTFGRVNVTKQLSFLGPNAGVNPNTAVRAPEAVVNGGFQFRSDNVTLDGLAFTGTTDSSESNIVQRNNSPFSNITVTNNLFNDVSRFVIRHQPWILNGVPYGGGPATNWTVTDNRINSFGNFNDNITQNDTAIRLVGVDNATITGNYINAPQFESLGILVDTYNGDVNISENTIVGADGFSISVASSFGSPSGINISNNNISDTNLGVLINGINSDNTFSDVTIAGNTITGLKEGQSPLPAGILLTSDILNGNGGAALSDITVTGNTVMADASQLTTGGDLIRVELGQANDPNGIVRLLNNTLTVNNQPNPADPNVNAIALLGQLAQVVLTNNLLTGDGEGTVGVSMIAVDSGDNIIDADYGAYPGAARIIATLNDIVGFENGVEAINTLLGMFGYLPNNDVAVFNANNIFANTEFGVINGDSADGGWIDARDNWWGNPTGPSSGSFIPLALDPLTLLLAIGSGDVIYSVNDPENNNILFDPFRNIPEPSTLALIALMLTAPRRRRGRGLHRGA